MRALILIMCLLAACKGSNGPCVAPPVTDVEPCANIIDANTKIYLTFGQSNAANHGSSTYTPKGNVYMHVGGTNCAKAVDPMPTATGCGGSIWTRLGDKLLEEDSSISSVLFVSIAVGGSAISEWVDGPYKGRLENALALPFQFDGLLWQQGETDGANLVSTEDYKAMFMEMHADIREFTDAPIYVAKSTRCRSLPWTQVAQAQSELPDDDLGILAGPDTDTLDGSFRFDGCHFSGEGLEEASELWLDAITQ